MQRTEYPASPFSTQPVTIAGVIGSQEGDDVGGIFRCLKAAHGQALTLCLEPILVPPLLALNLDFGSR